VTVAIWPRCTGEKQERSKEVVPQGAPPTETQIHGGRGETVSLQLFLWSSEDAELVPEVTEFIGPEILDPADSQLFRVDYLDISESSDHGTPTDDRPDPLGPVTDPYWPDALVPIGKDPYVGDLRNGAPFRLGVGQPQPLWLDVRIPTTATPGDYVATLLVRDDSRSIVGRIVIRMHVWDFAMPVKPCLQTAYLFDRRMAYQYHFGAQPQLNYQADPLGELYNAEAAAHRITLGESTWSIAGPYDPPQQANLTVLDWLRWRQMLSNPQMTSHPVPWSPGTYLSTNPFDTLNETLWPLVNTEYQLQGWASTSFLLTDDEPTDFTLANTQLAALHTAAPALRALITHAYDSGIQLGPSDIWCPDVTVLVDASGNLPTDYEGKEVWWYDGVDARNHNAELPDHFIDHPGVNQLVHGPMTWKYGLDGFLYWDTVAAYNPKFCLHGGAPDPWNDQYAGLKPHEGANGDGTLFYPGCPKEIGGATDIAVASLRLKLLRESWNLYDQLWMLRDQGKGDVADNVVNGLVATTESWTHDPKAYDAARWDLATALASP
jgi:hypothetical protein